MLRSAEPPQTAVSRREPERPHGQRGQRQRADDPGAGDRRVVPDADHEQHGQEERARRARRRAARGRRSREGCEPVTSSSPPPRPHACAPERGQPARARRPAPARRRSLASRMPGSARRRARARARARTSPRPSSERVRAPAAPRRAAAPRPRPGRCVHRSGTRGSAPTRTRSRPRGRGRAPSPSSTAERSRCTKKQQRQRGHGDRRVVGGHHPRDALDRRVEAPVQLGQGEHDDRGVRERDRDRDRERPALHVPQVSCGSRRPGSMCQ